MTDTDSGVDLLISPMQAVLDLARAQARAPKGTIFKISFKDAAWIAVDRHRGRQTDHRRRGGIDTE